PVRRGHEATARRALWRAISWRGCSCCLLRLCGFELRAQLRVLGLELFDLAFQPGDLDLGRAQLLSEIGVVLTLDTGLVKRARIWFALRLRYGLEGRLPLRRLGLLPRGLLARLAIGANALLNW